MKNRDSELEGDERHSATEETSEVTIAKNFPTVKKSTKPQIRESERTPIKINTPIKPQLACKTTFRNPKDQEMILKESEKESYIRRNRDKN